SSARMGQCVAQSEVDKAMLVLLRMCLASHSLPVAPSPVNRTLFVTHRAFSTACEIDSLLFFVGVLAVSCCGTCNNTIAANPPFGCATGKERNSTVLPPLKVRTTEVSWFWLAASRAIDSINGPSAGP